MSDGPEWFAPKRYGYGAGLPITWQGWALTVVFLAVSIGLAFTFAQRPIVLVASITPLLVLFVLITARTTRGGWRWRWGERA
jgi:hypothetical protein